MIKHLFTKLYFMFYHLILFFVTLWQKTRALRSFILNYECRFYPSCSDYFLESIKLHGLFFGFLLFAKRFLRCHPFCKGGIDEVPDKRLWT